MSDPRLEWFATEVTRNLRRATRASVDALLRVSGVIESIVTFFEGEGTIPVLIVTATEGEYFEGVDAEEGGRRGRIQKIELTTDYIVNSQVATSQATSPAANKIFSLFLIKTSTVPIPASNTPETESLLSSIEIVSSQAPSLLVLNAMIVHAFLPFIEDNSATAAALSYFSPTEGEDADVAGDTAAISLNNQQMLEEVITSTRRLGQHVGGYLNQVGSDVTLPMSDKPIIIGDSEAEIKAAASNDDTVKDVDEIVSKWHNKISETLAQEPQKEGPLGVVEFWREKYSKLSALTEQMNSPRVKAILRVASEAECNGWNNISASIGALKTQFKEATSNVRYLATLERNFVAIHNTVPGTSLRAIVDTLTPLMNNLRTIWDISNYFSSEERMIGLLEKVAAEISRKVVLHVDCRSILQKPPAEAKRKLKEGQQVLQKWKSAYLKVQEELNQNDKGQHWVFDTKRLFETTDYMSDRCGELMEIVSIIDNYNLLLGSQLRSVLNDATGIEKILKEVERQKHPIENIAFDPFERKSVDHWQQMYSSFNAGVVSLNHHVSQFIQRTFDDLRSAESAFDLLQSFKHMQSEIGGDAIDMASLMSSKADKILYQYHVEVERVRNIFEENCDKPPLTKNQPPIAGSIHWSSSLFQRLKKPIVRFQEEEMLGSAAGKKVKAEYVEVARMMKDYATSRFDKWRDDVNTKTDAYLKAPIIRIDEQGVYNVNFDNNLFLMIKEAKYLDRLGFEIPSKALNITLQDEMYHNLVENLKSMLLQFNFEIQLVSSGPEKKILSKQIADLKRKMEPGHNGELNWSSLGIRDFISNCNKQITEFRNLSRDIRKSAEHIQSQVINVISACQLLPDTREITYTGDFPELQHVVDSIERARQERIDVCVKAYNSIAPLLITIEARLTKSAGTGKCDMLKEYYAYWERKVWKALMRMVISSLSRLATLLGAQRTDDRRPRPPLFKVVFNLSGEPFFTPNSQEISNAIQKIVHNIIGSTKLFVRWMRDTCLDYTVGNVTPKTTDESNEPVFSFASDIESQSAVRALRAKILSVIQSRTSDLEEKRRSMRQDKYRAIYAPDKKIKLEAQSKDQMHWLDYDSKFQAHRNNITEYDRTHIVDMGFARCDDGPIYNVLINNLTEWIGLDGAQLNDIASKRVTLRANKIRKLSEELRRECTDHVTLKEVLRTMSEARDANLEMELDYREIEFMYDSLAHYGCQIAEEDLAAARGLRTAWSDVQALVEKIDVELGPKKAEYTVTTATATDTFQKRTEQLLSDFKNNGPSREGIDLDEGVALKNEWRAEVTSLQKERDELIMAGKLFGLPVTDFTFLADLNEALTKVEHVYSLHEQWMECLRRWNRTSWKDLSIEEMEKTIDEKLKQARLMGRTHRAIEPFVAIEKELQNFDASRPLLATLKSPALKVRHWSELMRVTNTHFNLDNITLDDLIAMELYRFNKEIEVIANTAGRELGVEKSIQEIKDYWASKEFAPVPYAPRGPVTCHVLSDTSEITEAVDDNILKIQALAALKWAVPFAADVSIWGAKLATISEVIKVWVKVQLQWQYLESIFMGSDDIKVQLPKEAAKFKDLDTRWKNIMAFTTTSPVVEPNCFPERLSELRYIHEKLEECQKDLTNYLESKRAIFPRFYFLSNDELLSILASSGARSVQKLMLKMFDNSAALKFKGTSETIIGVESEEGEVLIFDNHIDASQMPVEEWLMQVLTESKSTLRNILKAAVFYYPKKDRLEWIKEYHGMIGMCGCKVWWTFQIEDAFAKVKKGKKAAVKDLSSKLTLQLTELVSEMDKDIDEQYRRKVNTLIIVDVHGRDIVDRFVRDSVMDAREFEWESQLRFYWDKSPDSCVLKQCTGTFDYGYEYMGLNGRLVITPLTDRCFMTLTQALTFYLGGAPGGPAGTGKTESVKDLAKVMSIRCVVYNCGEGMDYKAMWSIFAGLSQTGAWGCFDEFNRIELPVLSVVSEQLRSIQAALRNQQTRFQFGDKEIGMVSTVGVFITMNPGYAGRVELPDNLKALFRPVVMVLPDMQLIAENMLFSQGFTSARELAKKMITLYSLARGQLSKQFHYDWGLRALKAVLVMAGQLKRGSPDLPEKSVLMRALRDMNAPKFIAEDEPLFKGLIGDLFPGLDPTRVPQENLAKAAAKVLTENNYKKDERQIDKVVQLYETMHTRHTTMVVGPTGGGKSVVINTLRRAQNELRLPTKLFFVNPKAQPVTVLYGVLDPMTRNWTDGLFSNIFREINKVDGNERERRYVVFDGDVDAKWVEDMNSVMDDNKLLTLPNGERIRLQPNCSLLFEVGDLQYASPATVSRVGMVYLDPTNLGWRPFAFSWRQTRRKDEVEILNGLFDQYVQPLVAFMTEGARGADIEIPPRLVIPTSDLGMVRQLCTMLQTIIPTNSAPEPKVIEAIFLFCCVWSFGALINNDTDRARFDALLKELCDWPAQPTADNFLTRFVAAGSYPEHVTLFDYFIDLEDNRWKPWQVLQKEFERPADNKFTSILVSTVDTVRGMWLLDRIVSNRTPVMFIGESGTAKTVTIQAYLRELKMRVVPESTDEEIHLEAMLLEMNFSSRTSSLDAQRTLEDNIEKRTNTVLGPPAKKKLLVFIDDINMPRVDTYGTQQPIAFLKLLIEHSSWYDRSDLLFKEVRDTQFLAAMAPPGGGRNALDPRFISLFSVYNIPFPSHESLTKIYEAILVSYYQNVSEEFADLCPRITSMTLQLYNNIVKTLPATPTKFHYIFNLRDLSRIYEGLSRVTSDRFTDVDSVIRLWRNEVTRVFADRMHDEVDKANVTDLIVKEIQDNFPASAEHALSNPLLFGDFGDLKPDVEDDHVYLGLYEDFGPDYGGVRTIVEEWMLTHKFDLVMFDMALDHLLRIVRVISLPRGHCLLVGVGGSGKQSLTRLAAAIKEMEVFEIVVSRGFNEDSFRMELQKLYMKVGVDNKKVVFLFTDNHVKEEGFLELINNMLASGMVPALFSEEEKEPLYQSVMGRIEELGLAPSKDNKWSLFVSKCRDNLRIVLSMSPSGDTLRNRCRNFPSFINNTTIDWFLKWPAQALEAVAKRMLAKENLLEYLRPAITEHAVFVHMTADALSAKYLHELKRPNYVTPKNFLAFLSNYAMLLEDKRSFIDDIVNKYSTGLSRLASATSQVTVLQAQLTEKQAFLDIKTGENKSTMEAQEVAKREAEEQKSQAIEKSIVAKATAEAIASQTVKVEAALEAALPAQNAAEEAAGFITRGNISDLKALKNPAAVIKTVVELVCILNGKLPKFENGLAIMANPGQFTEELKSAEIRQIIYEEGRLAKMDRHLATNVPANVKADLNVERLETVSAAALYMFKWVEAIRSWVRENKIVAPLKHNLEKSKIEMAAIEAELDSLREKTSLLEQTLAGLERDLLAGQEAAAKLKREADELNRRVSAANRLIAGFDGERKRWTESMANLRDDRQRLVGDCLASSAFLSYLGAFTYTFREEIFRNEWLVDIAEKQIPLSENFRIQQLLTDEVEMSLWASDGLPSDELSTQNGALTQVSTRRSKGAKEGKIRFPLCIDPQMQAVNWIKRQHANNAHFEVATFSDDFIKRLETCIQYGYPFLFENVDEFIDPIIDSVLDPTFHISSGQKCIRLGDKEIVWDDNFKLYLCTKMTNPNYPAEVFGKTLVINYGVTEDGLESQLLNYVVASERSDLQRQSDELVHTMAENRAQLKMLEDSLIRELTLAGDNLLENEELMVTLTNTKESAIEVQEKLEQAKETARVTDISRQEYRSAAKRGAVLYFVISQLSSIDSMYEYSLGAFLQDVFGFSVAKSEPSFEISTRLENIINALTYNLYCYVCMGIFEKHKLMFSLQIALRLLSSEGRMDHDELGFFLRGCVLASKDYPANPFGWLTERQWNDVCKLGTTCEVFSSLVENVQKDPVLWQEWVGLDRPEDPKFPLPNGYSDSITPFQRLCLLRCFRPDRVYVAVAQFISGLDLMGPRFTVPPILRYKDVFDKSSSLSPIVCIVSPGANPTDEILKLAEKEVGISKLRSISLGQGQGDEAKRMVEFGVIRGHWVLLQNCHLLVDWMRELEKLIEGQGQNPPHQEFRLWLTTEPSSDFPMGILQRSLKVVNEPPNGLKLNMKSTLTRVTEDQLDECPHPAFRPLVYTLAFFHAVVQERRKYGKIGWNVTYDFNETDFTISMRLLDTYLTKAYNNSDPIPWATLRYLVGEAMYGGRVTDAMDRRIVNSYLDEYFGDFLFDTFQPFHFFMSKEDDYSLPAGSSDLTKKVTLAAMLSTVEDMPLENQPDVFGLHPNAETGYLRTATELMWANLIDLMPRDSREGGGGESRESVLSKLAEDVLAQIPEPIDRRKVMKAEREKARAAKQENLQPVQVVLLQEIERWNKLVSAMRSSLKNLQKALVGTIGMSRDLDDLASALGRGQLPAQWRGLAPSTRKNLGRWLAHFQRRSSQFNSWIENGEPKVMWLSGLMIPESYISALVQTTCRKYVWALDRSTTFITVTKYQNAADVADRPKDGAYISGLFIEGARWDSKAMCLAPQEKKVLIYEMPIMHIIPMEASKLKLIDTFRTPVYVTSDRRNAAGVGLVFEADLPSTKHASHWILESVALCLNNDD